MQAYSLAVDPVTEEARLLTRGQRLAPPAGWVFQVRTPEEELLVDTTHTVATVLQDEFEDSYTLPVQENHLTGHPGGSIPPLRRRHCER